MDRAELNSGIVGYWHWPDVDRRTLPLIVMGHGFGAEWTFGTSETIADFTSAKFAVFTFDYRHYGESSGEPRQLLSVKKELDDWRSVLAYVRRDDHIDISRLAIWGSSLGGGHVLSIASEDQDLSAAVAQVPHCNIIDTMKHIPLPALLKTTGHALYDSCFGLFGGLHTIPIMNDPGKTGAMTFPGWKEEGLRLVPEGSRWKNAFPARSMLSVSTYSPERVVRGIRCPVCIHYGRKDVGVPPGSVERTVAKIEDVKLHCFDGDHFDVYHDPLRARIASEQLAFLKRVYN